MAPAKAKKPTLTDRELLERIYTFVEDYPKKLQPHSKTAVYDNKALMALLNIKDKYLKMLRDKGYIGYSRCGDKYWYTQADVDLFLSRFHYDAFAVGTLLL